ETLFHRSPSSLAASPTEYCGYRALTLGRSSAQNKKKAERGRLGALGLHKKITISLNVIDQDRLNLQLTETLFHRSPSSLAASPTEYCGYWALTLGRSSAQNKKKAERGRLGALGSFFFFFLLPPASVGGAYDAISLSYLTLSFSAISAKRFFSGSFICFHLSAHFLENSVKLTLSFGCFFLCSSRHICTNFVFKAAEATNKIFFFQIFFNIELYQFVENLFSKHDFNKHEKIRLHIFFAKIIKLKKIKLIAERFKHQIAILIFRFYLSNRDVALLLFANKESTFSLRY
ncbi:hypothetical protein BpHYR1_032538, partial [Brachionus plicatilis]